MLDLPTIRVDRNAGISSDPGEPPASVERREPTTFEQLRAAVVDGNARHAFSLIDVLEADMILLRQRVAAGAKQ